MSKLSVTDFGDKLIETGDLDPVYIMLWKGKQAGDIEPDQLKRWLLAYWCFYNVGFASWVSEYDRNSFWSHMTTAAKNEISPMDLGLPTLRWPRAAERRHFRGQKCVDAVRWFSVGVRYGIPAQNHPELWVCELTKGGTKPTLETVVKRASLWPQFGPWIAFKAADMIERVLEVPVEFPRELGMMYESPRSALNIVAQPSAPKSWDLNYKASAAQASHAYHELLDHFAQFPAPPSGNRACGPQEVETVLCKWKSYLGGHYYIGKDTSDYHQALKGWGSTADRLAVHLPAIPERAG